MKVAFCPYLPVKHVQPSFPTRLQRRSICMQSQVTITQWLQNNSAKVSRYITTQAEAGNVATKQGVQVTADAPPISKNTELLSVPTSLTLSTQDAKQVMQAEYPELQTLQLPKESWLALQLVHEKRNGTIVPLINDLPNRDELDAVLMWGEEEIEILKGSPIYDQSRQIRQAVRTEWEQVNECFPCELEEYTWAIAIIDARGVQVGTEIMLCGMLTRLGLGKGNVRVEAGGGLFGSKKIRLVADTSIAAGEQLTLPFTSSKAECVLERGFPTGDDITPFKLTLTTMDPFLEDKEDIVTQHAPESVQQGTFKLCLDEQGNWTAPEGMEEMLRLICLQGADAFLLEGVFRGEIWGLLALPVSEQNERLLCKLMIGGCDDLLDEYSGEKNGSETRRTQLAHQVVSGEQTVLKVVRKEFERRLNRLDALEYYAERRLKALDLLRPVDESEIVDAQAGGRMGRAFDDNYY